MIRVRHPRHVYDSGLLQDGILLAEAGKLLGDAPPSTTQRYAHLQEAAPSRIQRAILRPARAADEHPIAPTGIGR